MFHLGVLCVTFVRMVCTVFHVNGFESRVFWSRGQGLVWVLYSRVEIRMGIGRSAADQLYVGSY